MTAFPLASRAPKRCNAAVALVTEVSAEHFSMRELSRRAGTTMGSLYQYFPSKSAILRELAAFAVWAGAQADPSLRDLDVADTRRSADLLRPSLTATLATEDQTALEALALAVQSPLREQIIESLKTMLTATLQAC